MTKVVENPLDNYSDEKLKRVFRVEYHNVHEHGIKDGLLIRATLYSMQNELIERGYNPENCI